MSALQGLYNTAPQFYLISLHSARKTGAYRMNNHVNIVIFSYNRAMQLDYLIRSIDAFVKLPSYDVTVIYHCEPDHRESYAILIQKYTGRVKFICRAPCNSFISDILPTFFRFYGNAYWYWKYEYLRKNLDNFKVLFEMFLRQSSAAFVLLFTDDAILYNTFSLSSEIMSKLRENPAQYSYTAMVGRNITGVPDNILVENDHCSWNYYDKQSGTHWNWVFGVDGRVYERANLYQMVRKYLYESAITLEAFGVKYVRRHRLFSLGMSPLTSQVISVAINRVSTITNNYSGNIEVNFLKTKFIDGYALEYTLPAIVTQAAHFVPDQVRLKRGTEVITML